MIRALRFRRAPRAPQPHDAPRAPQSPGAPRAANPSPPARGEFVSVFGAPARGKRNWRLVALGLLPLLGGVPAPSLRRSLGSRIPPSVGGGDRRGRAVAFGPAEPLRPTDARVRV